MFSVSASEHVPDVMPSIDVALGGAWLLVTGLVAVQHYRGNVPPRRLPLLLGMCAIWLSYGLLQLTQGGPLRTGTPLNYALDGLAVVLLTAGLYGFFGWWRRREADQ